MGSQHHAEQAVDEVPRSLRKALAGHDGEEWRKALNVELNKFKKFHVFEEVDERDMKQAQGRSTSTRCCPTELG